MIELLTRKPRIRTDSRDYQLMLQGCSVCGCDMFEGPGVFGRELVRDNPLKSFKEYRVIEYALCEEHMHIEPRDIERYVVDEYRYRRLDGSVAERRVTRVLPRLSG